MWISLTGVFVAFSKVHSADNIHVLVVDGKPLEILLVELQDDTHIVVRLVDSLILGLCLPFRANKLPWKITLVVAVLGVMDGAVWGVFGRVLVLVCVCCSTERLIRRFTCKKLNKEVWKIMS